MGYIENFERLGFAGPFAFLIGDDFLLSGSQIVKQKPHVKHEWHADINWEQNTVYRIRFGVFAKEHTITERKNHPKS